MIGPRAGLLLSLALCAWATPVQALDVATAKRRIDHNLDQSYPDILRLYADIHAHPELGFQETRTATLLAAQMRKLGFTVTEHVGGTGVVAIVRNGPGPTVLVRTELDALPMEEKTGLPYASRVQADYRGQPSFVAHSCGHDIHMASWVGTARSLMAMKDRWQGTLMFIAQPAEETVGGAQAMLKDGLFERFPKPDYGFALHTGPYAAGQVLYRAGVLTSNVDSIAITFKGRGGHGSSPDKAIDPVLVAARFIVEVQSVVSRDKNPQLPGVVTIGAIQGGTAGNIIPDEVRVEGTIRNYDPQVRAKLVAGVERVARAAAMMAGAPEPDIKIGDGSDSVVNEPDLTDRTAAVFREAFGPNAIPKTDFISASEDYSAYAAAGVSHSLFFEIGIYDSARVQAAKNGGPPLPFNHSPYYASAPEPTIRTGVEAMTLAVLNILGN
ncbi:amidohydrolase [Rhizorhabdus wittichii]|uniref:Amidohydrolase n=2 Tax=Rhizorhabdus wittichii TaxID=160791 RepID=A0A975D7Y1_9SPHN|nr:amidohydrolase [Rhizorhabdus wittichii]